MIETILNMDIFSIICGNLSITDALNLRQTCKTINMYVKNTYTPILPLDPVIEDTQTLNKMFNKYSFIKYTVNAEICNGEDGDEIIQLSFSLNNKIHRVHGPAIINLFILDEDDDFFYIGYIERIFKNEMCDFLLKSKTDRFSVPRTILYCS